jgi:hypothetical protein
MKTGTGFKESEAGTGAEKTRVFGIHRGRQPGMAGIVTAGNSEALWDVP